MAMEHSMSATPAAGTPPAQGLYDPAHEHDACGVGFVVDMKGRKSHAIVDQALQVLKNLLHRGACGCEVNTGDGAGILIQMPHAFLAKACAAESIELPAPGQYGAGLIYLPPDAAERKECEQIFGKIVAEEGQRVVGWRDVPTDNSSLGETAKASEPFMRQVFIKRNAKLTDDMAFERKLFVIHKRATNEIRRAGFPGSEYWYTASLSFKTLIYKGMLNTEQVAKYFPDLADPAIDSALALVHSRFSTNTFPS